MAINISINMIKPIKIINLIIYSKLKINSKKFLDVHVS